ncbi:hypothetical protein [Streptomyces sp. C184]|uniref:hypothetical protein n=1 Tax=Streptomyces sp. C184 TaxID=3237121 RepID=UPI0034C6C4A3
MGGRAYLRGAADAMGMLGEKDAMQLAPAISRDMDCTDVVGVARRILTRQAQSRASGLSGAWARAR